MVAEEQVVPASTSQMFGGPDQPTDTIIEAYTNPLQSVLSETLLSGTPMTAALSISMGFTVEPVSHPSGLYKGMSELRNQFRAADAAVPDQDLSSMKYLAVTKLISNIVDNFMTWSLTPRQ